MLLSSYKEKQAEPLKNGPQEKESSQIRVAAAEKWFPIKRENNKVLSERTMYKYERHGNQHLHAKYFWSVKCT